MSVREYGPYCMATVFGALGRPSWASQRRLLQSSETDDGNEATPQSITHAPSGQPSRRKLPSLLPRGVMSCDVWRGYCNEIQLKPIYSTHGTPPPLSLQFILSTPLRRIVKCFSAQFVLRIGARGGGAPENLKMPRLQLSADPYLQIIRVTYSDSYYKTTGSINKPNNADDVNLTCNMQRAHARFTHIA